MGVYASMNMPNHRSRGSVIATAVVIMLIVSVVTALVTPCKQFPGHTDPHGKCQLEGRCCEMFWPPTKGSCDPKSTGGGCTDTWPNDPFNSGCCQSGMLAHNETTPPGYNCDNKTVFDDKCVVASCCDWWHFEGPSKGMICSYPCDKSQDKVGNRAGRCKTFEPDCESCSTKCIEWYSS